MVTKEEKRFAKKFNIDDLPDVPNERPPHLKPKKNHVVPKDGAPTPNEGIIYTGGLVSSGTENSVKPENFYKNFKVNVVSLTENDMEFDMVGIDVAFANAFVRILLAEFPTMAIENVYMTYNTSVIIDEVLAPRLGLIPIAADPRLFEYLTENDQPNEKNTIVFKLEAKCPKGEKRFNVLSSELKWLPNGSEVLKNSGNSTSKPETYTSFTCSQESFPELAKNPPTSSYHDIVIAVLGPGQEIELEAHAIKGTGKEHSKWNPVGTAWFRKHPEVVLLEEVEDELAERLVKACPQKVFDIEDMGKGRKRATVARSRKCTNCKECIRDDALIDRVHLGSLEDHVIFNIESVGQLPPEVLFTETVKILEAKCEAVIAGLP